LIAGREQQISGNVPFYFFEIAKSFEIEVVCESYLLAGFAGFSRLDPSK